MKNYKESAKKYTKGNQNKYKLEMQEDDLLKCIYSFLDKKHYNRAIYFIEGLSKNSKKLIPIWMRKNLIDLMNAEKEYFQKHFNPSEFKRRITLLNKNLTWKNTININGGNAALDILLHTIEIDHIEHQLLERVYPHERHITGLQALEDLITQNSIDIKKPLCLGIQNNGIFCFCFDEYIKNARYPDVQEFREYWYGKSYINLWNNSINKKTTESFKNHLEIDKDLITNIYAKSTGAIELNIKCIEDIFLTSAETDDFIHHTDFHRFNILILPDNDFRIVDWSGWCFAKIGMGYSLHRLKYKIEELTNEKIAEIINSFHNQVSNITIKQFAANFILYNAQCSLDKDHLFVNKFLNYYHHTFIKNKINQTISQ